MVPLQVIQQRGLRFLVVAKEGDTAGFDFLSSLRPVSSHNAAVDILSNTDSNEWNAPGRLWAVPVELAYMTSLSGEIVVTFTSMDVQTAFRQATETFATNRVLKVYSALRERGYRVRCDAGAYGAHFLAYNIGGASSHAAYLVFVFNSLPTGRQLVAIDRCAHCVNKRAIAAFPDDSTDDPGRETGMIIRALDRL